MVYESGYTTRRTYSSRPVVTSYSVSYPTFTKVARVYKTSYPIYSSSSYTRGSRVISSPVRVISSPTRVITRVVRSPSPVQVIRSTTTRVITSPERVSYTITKPTTYTSSYLPIYSSRFGPSAYYSCYTPKCISSYTPSSSGYISTSSSYLPSSRVYTRSVSPVLTSTVRAVTSPVRVVTSPVRVVTSPVRTTSSYLNRTSVPGYGARALTNYLAREPFNTFQEETGKIRNSTFTLIRDLHAPVVRQSRSCTPFPIVGYEPASELALDSYVSRVTNPVRHIAKEVHRMTKYAEPARRYVGKSHLASIRICGDKVYDIRRPMYDTDKVRTDINLLSWYLKHPTKRCDKSNDQEVESNEPTTCADIEE